MRHLLTIVSLALMVPTALAQGGPIPSSHEWVLVPAETFVIQRGSLYSGGVPDLAWTDNSSVVIYGDQENMITVQFEGTAPLGHKSVRLVITAALVTDRATTLYELYDWQSAQWVTFNPKGSASATYACSAERRVRIRITTSQVRATDPIRFDRVAWIFSNTAPRG